MLTDEGSVNGLKLNLQQTGSIQMIFGVVIPPPLNSFKFPQTLTLFFSLTLYQLQGAGGEGDRLKFKLLDSESYTHSDKNIAAISNHYQPVMLDGIFAAAAEPSVASCEPR